MGKNGSSIGTILASVFITLILSGAGMYFGMPLLFPNLNADLDVDNEYLDENALNEYLNEHEYIDENALNESLEENEYIDVDVGNLLQTKSVEVNTVDYINDFDLTYTKMPGMELNITTSGNSSLYVSLEGLFFLGMDNLFSGFTGYNISLVVSGIGNRTTMIYYYIQTSLSAFVYQSHNIYMTFDTGIISSGDYTISVYWRSVFDNPGAITTLTTEVQNAYHCPRKIYVQEFSAL